MEKDPIIYLDDILFSINLIQKYIAAIEYDAFSESYDVQDKVMRRLEIIAEAAKKLPDNIRQKYAFVPWKSIIGLRNIIAHDYNDVNLEEIWEIITHHLPETEKQMKQIKSQLSQ